eukprot:TRINITY_DN5268_c0_g1_i1.p1 TRINITY_DN5268_c0_g1~~TRINITY_DN5268_c0_g1_i1.p1  ORF type:complete len:249 (+),score=53.15 TRINITY_DN5268_c0_g1_i1:76-747(+)
MGSSESTPQVPSSSSPITPSSKEDSILSPSAIQSSSTLSVSPLEAYLSTLDSSPLSSKSSHPPAFAPLPFSDPFSAETNLEWKPYLDHRVSVIENRYRLWESLASYDAQNLVHPPRQTNPCSHFQENLVNCSKQSLSSPSNPSNQCFKASEQLRSCLYHKMPSSTDTWGNLDKEIDFHNRFKGVPLWETSSTPIPPNSYSYPWDPLSLAPTPPSISECDLPPR